MPVSPRNAPGRLLVNRWNDEDTLERLLRAQVVWRTIRLRRAGFTGAGA